MGSCSSTIRLRERARPACIIPGTALRTDENNTVLRFWGNIGTVPQIHADKRHVEAVFVPAFRAKMEFLFNFYDLGKGGRLHGTAL